MFNKKVSKNERTREKVSEEKKDVKKDVKKENSNDSKLKIKDERKVLTRNMKNVKDIIAPAGVDATHTNHIEIVASTTRYARSVIISTMPRMCTFPEFLRSMYTFGDANISVFIKPISENASQTDLNRRINEIESERIVAAERGNINRERLLAQKRMEAEELRDSIAGRI